MDDVAGKVTTFLKSHEAYHWGEGGPHGLDAIFRCIRQVYYIEN